MTTQVEFDDFVRLRSPGLLRLAYALTRDHARAEDLLQTALARSWPAWRRIDGDPEPYVRRVLLNTYNSWWRRRWNDELPSEAVPDRTGFHPQSSVDDRDEVWRALGRLARQQRAVLVLRYLEDLSEAQIAEALDISPGAVKSHAAKGLARLRLDPSLRDLPLPERPEPPAGTERVTAVRARIGRRRRSRIAAVACLVLLALLAGYTLPWLPGTGDPVTPSPEPSPTPSPSPSATVFAFPEYYEGQRMIASRVVTLTENAPVLTFTPPAGDLTFHLTCAVPVKLRLMAGVTINGRGPIGTSCGIGGDGISAGTVAAKDFGDFGVVAGSPAVLAVSFELDGVALGSVGLPAPATVAIAVGVPVPFLEYPLPPQPTKLPSITNQATPYARLYAANGYAAVLRAADVTLDKEGRRVAWFCVHSQTPGVFHVTVDGKELSTSQFTLTGYGLRQCVAGPDVHGDVQVRATAEYATGEWMVEATDGTYIPEGP